MKKVLLILVIVMAVSICSYGQELRPVKGLNRLWGFVDETGKMVIPCQFDAAREFSEGLSVVRVDNLYGYINKSGKEVIPCIYDEAENFIRGLARVKRQKTEGYIDITGTFYKGNREKAEKQAQANKGM